MSNLKYKLEALLFSSARSMKIDELCALTKADASEVREKLKELKEEYEKRDSSITLIDEGNSFKLNVKSEHLPVIQQIVTETELSKTLMETLAVIAFKYPIKQSELIKLRTNKAYDHLTQLEEMDYITRQKFGRTKLIKLTPKFFEYFDLPQDKLKEKFESFEGIAKAIKEKEDEVKKTNEEIRKQAVEAGKKKEVDLIDDKGRKKKLEEFDEPEEEKAKEESEEIKPVTEKMGNLEVVDVEEREEAEEPEEEWEDSEEPEQSNEIEEPSPIKMTEKMGKGVLENIKQMVKPEEPVKTYSSQAEQITDEFSQSKKSSQEIEDEIDSKVEELLHPRPLKKEPSTSFEEQTTKNDTVEPEVIEQESGKEEVEEKPRETELEEKEVEDAEQTSEEESSSEEPEESEKK